LDYDAAAFYRENRDLQIILVRVYISIFTKLGGNLNAMRHWVSVNNYDFDDEPGKLLLTRDGVEKIVEYLKASNWN